MERIIDWHAWLLGLMDKLVIVIQVNRQCIFALKQQIHILGTLRGVTSGVDVEKKWIVVLQSVCHDRRQNVIFGQFSVKRITSFTHKLRNWCTAIVIVKINDKMQLWRRKWFTFGVVIVNIVINLIDILYINHFVMLHQIRQKRWRRLSWTGKGKGTVHHRHQIICCHSSSIIIIYMT